MVFAEEVLSKPAFAVISAGLTERAGSQHLLRSAEVAWKVRVYFRSKFKGPPDIMPRDAESRAAYSKNTLVHLVQCASRKGNARNEDLSVGDLY